MSKIMSKIKIKIKSKSKSRNRIKKGWSHGFWAVNAYYLVQSEETDAPSRFFSA